MKVTITDPWLGEREIGPGAAIIYDQLKLLRQWRDTRANPSQHLLDDIKVYEFIVSSQDPDLYTEKYMLEMGRLRSIKGVYHAKKMDAAKNLGWF